MQRLHTTKYAKLILAVLVVLLVGAVGAKLYFTGHAATPTVSLEAEAGAVTGNALKVADTTASGGNMVQFGITKAGFSAGVVDNCGGVGSSTCTAAGYAVQAQLWHDAGITSVRTWLGCNVDALTRWNKDLKYYVAQGIQPILVVACGQTYASVQASGFATWYGPFVKTMAGLGVHNYEFGNEMNGNTQWHTTDTSDALCGANQAQATDYAAHVLDYVNWLHQGYTLAHANDANANVISGGVEYSTTWQFCIVPSKTWITEMAKDGADRYMDSFGYHPYSPATKTPAGAVAASVSALQTDNYDAIKAGLGIVDSVPVRPVWITEVGLCLSTQTCAQNGRISVTSDTDRANVMKSLYDGLKGAGAAGPVDWYWDAGDGYGIESGGTAAGCSFGTTTLGATYTGHVLTPTLCAIKAYFKP